MGNFKSSFIIFAVTFIYLLPTMSTNSPTTNRIVTKLIYRNSVNSPHSTNSPTTNRIVTKLIYRNSVNSPHFDQTASAEERENRDMDDLLALLNQIKVEGDFSELDFQAPIISRRSSSLFLVRFEMGEPPIPQAVALDTGSSLFWVHGAGIGGDYALEKKYNPGESSTYSELVGCDKYCINTIHCPFKESCDYEVTYGSGSGKSEGNLASERFIFRSFHSNDSVIYDNITFGCSRDAHFAQSYNGILGLGAAKYSILSQGNHYYANLEGISFGGKMLDIDKTRLTRSNNYKGGALFDSGSSYSVLQSIAYNKLEEKIVEFVGDSLETTYYGEFKKLCYVGNLYTDFIEFPTVTFHFANNAAMELEKDNLFKQNGVLVRLNVVDAIEINLNFDFSIIGVNLQQYFYLAYVLNTKQLSFKRMGCENLWDDYL